MQCSMLVEALNDIYEAIGHASFRTGIWSSDTVVHLQRNNRVLLSARALSSGLKKGSLHVVACDMLNDTTRDATLETLAAMSTDDVGRDNIKFTRDQFINRGDGSVAIDGGWSHRKQALENCVQMVDIEEEGRDAITVLIADENGGMKKLKDLHSAIFQGLLLLDPGHYAKTEKGS
eukprot:IDg12071t1